MNQASFAALFQWVIHNGYWLMFLAMLIEGPLVTAAAAFGAALGYFDIWIVLLLSILGDYVADLAYYAIGYTARITLIEKFGRHLGLTKERILSIENLLKEHGTKTLVIMKLTPLLPAPGLTAVGSAHYSFKKFLIVVLVVTLPKSLFFTLAGFFFGKTFYSNSVLQHPNWILLGIALLVIATSAIYSLIAKKISKKVEEIEIK